MGSVGEWEWKRGKLFEEKECTPRENPGCTYVEFPSGALAVYAAVKCVEPHLLASSALDRISNQITHHFIILQNLPAGGVGSGGGG